MDLKFNADILEDNILALNGDILQILLTDRTTGRNIIWATDDYAARGEGYQFNDEITVERITGDNGHVIQPRVRKTTESQRLRSRDKAEVFTPSWICNAQNNLIDEAWFGRKDVFNKKTRKVTIGAPRRERLSFLMGRRGRN